MLTSGHPLHRCRVNRYKGTGYSESGSKEDRTEVASTPRKPVDADASQERDDHLQQPIDRKIAVERMHNTQRRDSLDPLRIYASPHAGQP